MILKPEEDIDFIGKKGGYKLQDTFEVIILVQGEWSKEIQESIISVIP